MTTPDFTGVTQLLNRYFDGLYLGDTKILGTVFHENAQYVCATEDQLVLHDMAHYFPIVDKRPSPASKGEARQDVIQSIQFAGSKTAFAHVNCAIGEKYFTDFLTLILTENGWRIISKVFHYDLKPTA